MTVRSVTLLQLRTDIAEQCDIAGAVGASSRYTPTALNRLINQSIQRFRERLSNEGSTLFLVAASVTLGPGATSPYPFFLLDPQALSPAMVRSYMLSITVSGEPIALMHVPLRMHTEYGSTTQCSRPQAWAHFAYDKVAVFPPPDQAYTALLWYLPLVEDLTTDSDTIDGVSGWEDFIVWDVVCRLIVKDQYPAAYAQADRERQLLWQDVIRSATKVTSAGGRSIGRDTFGARIYGGQRKPWLPI